MVGDYELGTSLRDVLFQMTTIHGDKEKRTCPKLFHLKKERIVDLISAVLDERSDEIYQYTPLDFLPARFDVRIPVDVFDSWEIFLVEGGEDAKLLCREIDSSEIGESTLASGEFDRIFCEAYTHLERLYEQEVATQDTRR
jgi:hypothetical protein